jgi:hypothetical protein
MQPEAEAEVELPAIDEIVAEPEYVQAQPAQPAERGAFGDDLDLPEFFR